MNGGNLFLEAGYWLLGTATATATATATVTATLFQVSGFKSVHACRAAKKPLLFPAPIYHQEPCHSDGAKRLRNLLGSLLQEVVISNETK